MKYPLTACCFIVVTAPLAVGCAGGDADREIVSATSDRIGAAAQAETSELCQLMIDEDVFDRALNLDGSSVIAARRALYGVVQPDQLSYGDAVLVRVDSTRTGASDDYLAVTSRVIDGVIDPEACTLPFVGRVATTRTGGTLPDLDDLVPALPAAGCRADMEQAVLDEAQAINDTAEIVGRVPLYGATGAADITRALLVRVSDEVEPSDWVVVSRSQGCEVQAVQIVGSGDLPEIPGLD